MIKSGDPVEQGRPLKYASLVANTITLSDVADLNQVLSDMASNGHPVTPALVARPAPTSADTSYASDSTRSTWSICHTHSTHSRSSSSRTCGYCFTRISNLPQARSPGLADSRKLGLGKTACEAAAVAFADFMLGARGQQSGRPGIGHLSERKPARRGDGDRSANEFYALPHFPCCRCILRPSKSLSLGNNSIVPHPSSISGRQPDGEPAVFK